MYVVIRKFTKLRSVAEAARRAETGIGRMLQQCAGFQGYYVFDCGGGVGGSVTLFETEEEAMAANAKALAWVHASLADIMDGEPEVTSGAILACILPEQRRALSAGA